MFGSTGTQIISVIGAIIIWVMAVKTVSPHTRTKTPLMWIAFGVTVICGLMLGNGLASIVHGLVGLQGPFGQFIGSIGQLLAFTLGWYGVSQIVPLVRDVIDGKPDAEARWAALWIPTALPAGWASWVALMHDPRGLGTSLKAAIMAAITLTFCLKIIKAAIVGQKAPKMWKYVAAVVSLIAGLVLIPAFAYLYTLIAPWITQMHTVIEPVHVKVIVGIIGFCLFVRGLIDVIKDRQPDEHVRAFCMYGIPCLALSFGIAFAFISDAVGGGAGNITGTVS